MIERILIGDMMNTRSMLPLKDPNEVLDRIKKILEKRKDAYKTIQEPNIKVEIITERCKSEYCPFDHIVVNITADYMLGEELLDICRYLKKNKLPFCYTEGAFKVALS